MATQDEGTTNWGLHSPNELHSKQKKVRGKEVHSDGEPMTMCVDVPEMLPCATFRQEREEG